MDKYFFGRLKVKRSLLILAGLLMAFFVLQISYLEISRGRINCDDALTGLTALHILHGDRPIFLPGQVYGGTLKACLTAGLFKIFGASPFLLLFTSLLFAAGYIISTYYLGRLLFSEGAGLLGALFLAIAPAAFFGYAHSAIGTYIENVFFGNIILILTVWLVYKNKWTSLVLWALLGLIAGVAWWVNFAVIYYLAAALFFIFLRDKIFFLKKEFYSGLVGFFLGSMPFWVFNFNHGWLSFSKAENALVGWRTVISNFISLFTGLWPKIWGVTEPAVPVLSPVLAVIFVGVGLAFIWNFRRGIMLLFRLSLKETSGPEILLALWTVVAVIYCLSPYGEKDVVRFILPVYSVWPLVLGWAVIGLNKKSRWLAGGLVAAVLLVNGYQNLFMFQNSLAKAGENYPGEKKLISFITDHQLTAAYAPKEIGQIITFKTGEKIICASQEVEVNPGYALTVDASVKPAFIFMDAKKSAIFETALKAAGGRYRRQMIEPLFSVFYNFQPPPDNFEQVPVLLMGVKASANQAGAFSVVDRDGATVWEPHKNIMVPGEEIIVDIGSLQPVGKIVVLPAEFIKEKYSGYPLGFKMYGSTDTQKWLLLADIPDYFGPLFWDGPRPFYKIPNGRIEVRFPPEEMRFFKFVQTGASKKYGWGINEIYFYEPLADNVPVNYPAAAATLIKTLEKVGVKKIWADFWLNPLCTGKTGGRLLPPETFNQLDFDRRWPFAANPWRVAPDHLTGLVSPAADAEVNESCLLKRGLKFKKIITGPWMIFYDFLNQSGAGFFWDGRHLLNYSAG